jgi:hypothetical protein
VRIVTVLTALCVVLVVQLMARHLNKPVVDFSYTDAMLAQQAMRAILLKRDSRLFSAQR